MSSWAADSGVSFVIPVLNGVRWLPDVIAAVVDDCGTRPFEVIVVDDGSTDGSADVVRHRGDARIHVVDGPRRGAAAAVNAGLDRARFDVVAQIDQDVIVGPGWLTALLAALAEPGIAAAQGWYVTDSHAPLLSRVMSLDLEHRYGRIAGGETDHVCTGNVIWRRDAVARVGGLDESLGYGYDNDLSYRLKAAGYRLVICRDARSLHRWRDGWRGYAAQQYGFGYGRIDLVARHGRVFGDRVSPPTMMAHPIVFASAVAAAAGGLCALLAGASPFWWWTPAAVLIGALVIERAAAGAIAAVNYRDRAAWLFPIVHMVRDAAWVAAIACWVARRARGVPLAPHHSMRPRPPHPPVPHSVTEDR